MLTVTIATLLQTVATDLLQTHVWLLYVSVNMLVVFMCVMACCSQALRMFPMNYIFLLVFPCVEALMVVGFASHATQYTPQVVFWPPASLF